MLVLVVFFPEEGLFERSNASAGGPSVLFSGKSICKLLQFSSGCDEAHYTVGFSHGTVGAKVSPNVNYGGCLLAKAVSNSTTP